MSRDGYAANAGDRCFFCKAELLDVLGPLAQRARPRTRRDRHQRRRRPSPASAGHPGGRRARRGHPAARRRAHQGPGAGGLARLGAADLGQAGRGVPVQPGRLRRRRSARLAWPGSSAPRPHCARRSAAAGCRSRDLRVRDLGDRARVEVDRELVDGARPTAELLAAVGPGFDDGRGRPARLPVRVDERGAEPMNTPL